MEPEVFGSTTFALSTPVLNNPVMGLAAATVQTRIDGIRSREGMWHFPIRYVSSLLVTDCTMSHKKTQDLLDHLSVAGLLLTSQTVH